MFGKSFDPKGQIPLSDLKNSYEGGSPRSSISHQNLPIVALEMWAEVRRSRQNIKFCGKNVSPRGQSP